MDRVIVTRGVIGVCHMQVCVVNDATDEEILEACNKQNPSGTSLGWCNIIRSGEHGPVSCRSHEGRMHILVSC
jgi:hypothetical protein